MSRNWITILPLVLLVGISNYSTAQEVKKITLTGRVVDYNARPLVSAEVAAYEKFYDSSGQEYTKLLDKVKKTGDSLSSSKGSLRLAPLGSETSPTPPATPPRPMKT